VIGTPLLLAVAATVAVEDSVSFVELQSAHSDTTRTPKKAG
jgi:hypothetical protein